MNNEFKLPGMLLGNDIEKFKTYHKFIIDTDAGGDDAHAIMMASYILKYIRKDAELLGITCVSGNASLENVIKNVYITSKYCHFDNPPKIYRGCTNDTLRRFHRDHFFKEDGFGGV
jgi:purine nucleosidase